jgi:hypothetical protein
MDSLALQLATTSTLEDEPWEPDPIVKEDLGGKEETDSGTTENQETAGKDEPVQDEELYIDWTGDMMERKASGSRRVEGSPSLSGPFVYFAQPEAAHTDDEGASPGPFVHVTPISGDISDEWSGSSSFVLVPPAESHAEVEKVTHDRLVYIPRPLAAVPEEDEEDEEDFYTPMMFPVSMDKDLSNPTEQVDLGVTAGSGASAVNRSPGGRILPIFGTQE